jgi:hypothetical protein
MGGDQAELNFEGRNERVIAGAEDKFPAFVVEALIKV